MQTRSILAIGGENSTTILGRGVEFRAHGDKLRFRPLERLSPIDLENLRAHKTEILCRLRLEEINRFADLRPMTACDRCRSTDYRDTPIHAGQSVRRDCGGCRRFLGWPRWYGRTLDQKSCGNIDGSNASAVDA